MEKGGTLRYNKEKETPGGSTMSLFQKKIEPRCVYCSRSRTLSEDQVICEKKGVMSAGSNCRSFKYDPLKRVPPRPMKADFTKLKDEDFSL